MKNKLFSICYFIFYLLISESSLHALIDLNDLKQDYVLETKRIHIPGYPHAFNPAIIRWKGSLLLGFRDIPDAKKNFNSNLGLIWLNEDFQPIGLPQMLNTRESDNPIPSRAEDGRLIVVNDRLYLVYSDNCDAKITKGGFRVYVAEIKLKEDKFFLENIECLSRFEGESINKREKNWVPFNYKNNLFLAYSLQPHLIFKPILGEGKCETVSLSQGKSEWNWGELRGGTPGIIDGNHYLAFFHTCQKMESVQSDGRDILHYFMGAYTFALHPPFDILSMSHEPIMGPNFYEGEVYKPYWHPILAVFPCGFVFDENHIWVVYGRQDHEAWVVKLDKKKFMQSLIPVHKIQ